MADRMDRAPKPWVRPKMNTDTRRHDEKSAYHRKAKYKSDPIDDEELAWTDEEDGGVLDEWTDEDGTTPGGDSPNDPGHQNSEDPATPPPPAAARRTEKPARRPRSKG